MLNRYVTVDEKGEGVYTEKKSRFLGEAVHVESQEAAESYIAGVRKKYYDARHHCFAYVAGEPGTPEEIVRASDDGEPSGTAGKPILEVIQGKQLHNTLIVVTRYFGGTLLGTGGLVRSYTASAQDALAHARMVEKIRGMRLRIGCTYPAYGKFQYQFSSKGIRLLNEQFGQDVTFEVLVPEDDAEDVRKMVTETTDGRGKCEEVGEEIYSEALTGHRV